MAKKSLKEKRGPIATGKFSVEESKIYIVAAIICFHIIPLFFVFMGEMGQQILLSVFIATINPLIVFSICCFRACRLGFSFKFPLIMALLGGLSIGMYYNYLAEAVLTASVLFFLVYLILALASELLGGFLKKVIGG